MDPQGHCAAGLSIPEQRLDLTVADAMLASDQPEGVDTTRLLWRASRNLDLIPSTMHLAALEAARGGLAEKPEPEKALRRALHRMKPKYDVCLIDCSPSIGLLAYNALAAADMVLIPVETGFFSLQGASKQVSTIRALGRRLGTEPEQWVLPTMHDPASMLAQDLLAELIRRFESRVIPHAIRYDRSLREAASFGQPVGEYAPESSGAEDYRRVAAWALGELVKLSAPAARPADPLSDPHSAGRFAGELLVTPSDAESLVGTTPCTVGATGSIGAVEADCDSMLDSLTHHGPGEVG